MLMTKRERLAMVNELMRVQKQLLVLTLTLGERSFINSEHAIYLRRIHANLFGQLFIDSDIFFVTIQMERTVDEAA